MKEVIRPIVPTVMQGHFCLDNAGVGGRCSDGGLNHPNEPLGPQGVLDHLKIAGLEDIERHLRAGQQKCAPESGNTGMRDGMSLAFRNFPLTV